MNKPIPIAVWDPLVRLFHWSLVAAFAASWFTREEHYTLHLQAGYTVLGLIGLRIIWGLIGSQYARFSEFLYSPSTTVTYIKTMISGHSKRYIGHNPAAGVMIMALLINLLIITISGIALDGAENWSGPMAEMNLFQYKHLILSTHTVSTDIVLILIVLHLSGVLYSSLAHRENLIRSMFNGKKRSF